MYSDDITNINCFRRLLPTGKPRQSEAPLSRLQSLLLHSYGMPRLLPEMVKLKIVSYQRSLAAGAACCARILNHSDRKLFPLSVRHFCPINPLFITLKLCRSIVSSSSRDNGRMWEKLKQCSYKVWSGKPWTECIYGTVSNCGSGELMYLFFWFCSEEM